MPDHSALTERVTPNETGQSSYKCNLLTTRVNVQCFVVAMLRRRLGLGARTRLRLGPVRHIVYLNVHELFFFFANGGCFCFGIYQHTLNDTKTLRSSSNCLRCFLCLRFLNTRHAIVAVRKGTSLVVHDEAGSFVFLFLISLIKQPKTKLYLQSDLAIWYCIFVHVR